MPAAEFLERTMEGRSNFSVRELATSPTMPPFQPSWATTRTG